MVDSNRIEQEKMINKHYLLITKEIYKLSEALKEYGVKAEISITLSVLIKDRLNSKEALFEKKFQGDNCD